MATKLTKKVKNSFALAVVLLSSTITLATKTVVPANALSKSNVNHTNTVQLAKFVEGEGTSDTPIQSEGTPDTPIQNEGIPETPTQNENQVHTVDWYKKQVGLSTTAELGEERWFDNFCEVRAYQGAVTFNRGITETRVCQQNLPGWQIIGHKLDVIENTNGRGSWGANVIAENGNYVASEQEIGSQYKIAMELAGKYKDIEAKTKLEIEYKRNLELIRSYSSNKNSLELKATANGGAFKKSAVRIIAKVLMKRVK